MHNRGREVLEQSIQRDHKNEQKAILQYSQEKESVNDAHNVKD